jgi:hypothetical protein
MEAFFGALLILLFPLPSRQLEVIFKDAIADIVVFARRMATTSHTVLLNPGEIHLRREEQAVAQEEQAVAQEVLEEAQEEQAVAQAVLEEAQEEQVVAPAVLEEDREEPAAAQEEPGLVQGEHTVETLAMAVVAPVAVTTTSETAIPIAIVAVATLTSVADIVLCLELRSNKTALVPIVLPLVVSHSGILMANSDRARA